MFFKPKEKEYVIALRKDNEVYYVTGFDHEQGKVHKTHIKKEGTHYREGRFVFIDEATAKAMLKNDGWEVSIEDA